MSAMSARTPAKRFKLCVALVCDAVSSWLLAHLIVFPYGRDQAIYALAAQAMLEGGAPYVDIWDFKTPGVYFVFAAAEGLFGRSMSAIRIVEALGFASLLPAFALLSRTDDDKEVWEGVLRNDEQVGVMLRDLKLPGDVLIVALRRDDELLVPHGNTRLDLGDRLTLVGSLDAIQTVRGMML